MAKKMTKLILLLLALSSLSVILMALFLILRANNMVYFDEQEVITTCEVLQLPTESEFCAQPANQNPQTLEETLRRVYPFESTNIVELNDSFSVHLNYESDSCDGLQTLPNNSQPTAKQCINGFSYYASLPIFSARLWITFDENTNVENYTVAYDGGS